MSFVSRVCSQFKNGGWTRKYCTKTAPSLVINESKKAYGQPHFGTHRHLLNEDEVTPMITRKEYQNRRHRLVQCLSENITTSEKNNSHLIIIPATSKKYMSDKIPYFFRQNTDFLYLTGCREPDCCLAISMNNTDSFCVTLFTRNEDKHAELWDGPRTHPEDAKSFFGVDDSLPISEFEKFLYGYRKVNPNVRLWYDLLTVTQNDIHTIVCNFIKEGKIGKWESPKHFIHSLRLYKSSSEVALMQKACDISAEAFIKTMASSKPGVSEHQLFATVDYESRMLGADYLAYPPVVAGGDRATIIHYIDNNQIVNNHETVLMDSGCEYHGYASDITRTWPINGRFTEAQVAIYEVVYSVQTELINMCSNYPSLDSLFESMCYLLGKRLQEAGILKSTLSDSEMMKAAYELCPHHVSHYLGMDIHDTPNIKRSIKIEPGMVITIEPGIYVNRNNKLVDEKYRGIGVRIEDDVLITENGPVILSDKCPKRLQDIEEISSAQKTEKYL